ncbi:MAG: hypothetical protein K0R50_4694 [Eubacterium sp.]|jgi:predicted acetyltransferase|nr:hypothetical protein [Eubacterium sp.]
MIFREVRPEEILLLFEEGYKEWSKNRTFEQYYIDNGKEDSYGTRYVIEMDGEIVSSTIVLMLKPFNGRKVYGFGSVLTPKRYAGNGYATELLNNCIKLIRKDAAIFLFSDINPVFYEKFGFRILPPQLQKKEKSVCMVYCSGEIWEELLTSSKDKLPDYF